MEIDSKHRNVDLKHHEIRDIYSKYETLKRDISDFKSTIDTWIEKNNKGCFGKTNEIMINFRSILKSTRNYDKKNVYYAYTLKILYDSIQFFFEPLVKNSEHKIYEFLNSNFISTIFTAYEYVIREISVNKKSFFNKDHDIGCIINQSVNNFKAIVIFFYALYIVKSEKNILAEISLNGRINFFSGKTKFGRCLKVYDYVNLFKINETKKLFIDISEKVEEINKKTKKNRVKPKTSELEFMNEIKVSQDITKILCDKEIVFYKANELKPKELPKVTCINDETKTYLPASDQFTDIELKNILTQISNKCKNEIRVNWSAKTDYDKKLCYLWLDLGKIIKFKYDGNLVQYRKVSLIPTFCFFKNLVLEHKSFIENNIKGFKSKHNKESAIEDEFISFSRFIDYGEKLLPDLYLCKIKELYNCIQILFKVVVCFSENSNVGEPLYKSFSSGGCYRLIRALQNVIFMIHKNKNDLCGEIDTIGNIDDLIEFNINRLEYIFTFFYIAKEINLISAPSVVKNIDDITRFFSGSLPASTSSKYAKLYLYSFFDGEKLKKCFSSDFFKTVKDVVKELIDKNKNYDENNLRGKIKLCNDIIEKLKEIYKSDGKYKFLDSDENGKVFSDFYFDAKKINESQKLAFENIVHDKNNEFVITLVEPEFKDSERAQIRKQRRKNEVENEISNYRYTSVKYLKKLIDNFQMGVLSVSKLRSTFECYNKIINEAYIKNDLDLEFLKDLLEFFTCTCNIDNKNNIYRSFSIDVIYKFIILYKRAIEATYEIRYHNDKNNFFKIIDFEQHKKQFVNIFKYLEIAELKNVRDISYMHSIFLHFSFLKSNSLDYWFLNERRRLFKIENESLENILKKCNKPSKIDSSQSMVQYDTDRKKYTNILTLENFKKKNLVVFISNMCNLVNKSYLDSTLDYKSVRRFFDILLLIYEKKMYKLFNFLHFSTLCRILKRTIELIYEIKKIDTRNDVFGNISIEKLKKYAERYKNMVRNIFKSAKIKDLPDWKLFVLRSLVSFFGGNNELKSNGYWFLKERYELFNVEVTKDEFKGYYDETQEELEKRKKSELTESDEDISLFSDCEEEEKEDYEDSFVEGGDKKYEPELKYDAQKGIKDSIKVSKIINTESDIDSEENSYFSSDEEYQPYEKHNKHAQKNTKRKEENNIKSKKEKIKKLYMDYEPDTKLENDDKKHNFMSLNERYDNDFFDIEKKSNSKKRHTLKKNMKETYKTSNTYLGSEENIIEKQKLINKKRNAEPLNDHSINREIINYVGNVPGNGNCLLYSILCQITQEEFDKLVDYVKENDMIYKEFKSKFWCEDYEFEFDDIFPNFLGVIEKYRANNKTKFSRQANLVRSAIVIKCIENFVRDVARNKNIENYGTMSLKNLIEKINTIGMNLEMIENLISNFGKDMNIEYEDAENKKVCSMNTRGSFIFDDYFDVFKSISDLLNRPVFVYKDKITADEKEEYIFKRPIMHEKNLMQIDKSLIKSEYVSQDDKNRYKDYFKAEITKLGSDYILLYFSESHISPCGLNKDGKKYYYNDIDIKINGFENEAEALLRNSLKEKIDYAKNICEANKKNNRNSKPKLNYARNKNEIK